MTTPHRPTQPPTLSASDLADSLTTYREAGPLVQCLTNTVVTNWTANVLLASGAPPPWSTTLTRPGCSPVSPRRC
ncbi:hypothetical protein GCM10025862_28910 [Arsenicicoccus piscis]|uniref:hydroxyethylthiazole kinase n=1 Tax=Arsenicicoccus piscis TaxID=673954 RepID=A0ABQ6HRM6_9MICO|nr:hypothetical protein GCM10025862_28910 [Arsenicicoccus piscis]